MRALQEALVATGSRSTTAGTETARHEGTARTGEVLDARAQRNIRHGDCPP